MAKHRHNAGIRTVKWMKSDRPYDSEFAEHSHGHASARVMPLKDGGFEWSIWIGRNGRVLHASDVVRTRSEAKTKAAEYLLHNEWINGVLKDTSK